MKLNYNLKNMCKNINPNFKIVITNAIIIGSICIILSKNLNYFTKKNFIFNKIYIPFLG